MKRVGSTEFNRSPHGHSSPRLHSSLLTHCSPLMHTFVIWDALGAAIMFAQVIESAQKRANLAPIDSVDRRVNPRLTVGVRGWFLCGDWWPHTNTAHTHSGQVQLNKSAAGVRSATMLAIYDVRNKPRHLNITHTGNEHKTLSRDSQTGVVRRESARLYGESPKSPPVAMVSTSTMADAIPMHEDDTGVAQDLQGITRVEYDQSR